MVEQLFVNVWAVDDDDCTVEMISDFHRANPHIRCQTFISPKIFLHELETVQEIDFPGLVFVDIMMPERDGLEMLEDAQKVCKKRGKTMPEVVIVSGNVDAIIKTSEVQKIRALGYSILPKPFRMESILTESQKLFAKTFPGVS